MKFKSTISSLPDKLDKLAEILLLVYLGECVLGCSGRWLEIGPLSIRMVLFALCFISSLPAVIRNFKQVFISWPVIITLVFGVYYLFCAVRGFVLGNPFGFIWADISGLLALVLIPGFIAVLNKPKAMFRAISAVFWCSVAMAAAVIMLHFLLPVLDTTISNLIYHWITGKSMGGMALTNTGILRIYLKSFIFLQVAVVLGLWKFPEATKKQRIVLCIAEGILLCALILSYTRGFWLGLAAAALLILIVNFPYWKKYLNVAGRMLAVFAVFSLLSTAIYKGPYMLVEIVNRFDPNLIVMEAPKDQIDSSFIGDSDDMLSDDKLPDENPDDDTNAVEKENLSAVKIRQQTLTLHWQRIASSPILGLGLGENLDEIRHDGKTEYMYLDMMMKTGIVGLILYLLAFFGVIPLQVFKLIQQCRAGRRLHQDRLMQRNILLLIAYLSIAITSFFNPFLNNPMGIAMLTLVSTAVESEKYA